MGDMFSRGTAWLAGMLEQHAGSQVLYTRGSDSVTLTATVGRSERTATNSEGATYVVETRDYTVDAEKLILSGNVVLPEPGDTITETRLGKTLVCKVLDVDGLHCYELDPTRKILRIHTTLISLN